MNKKKRAMIAGGVALVILTGYLIWIWAFKEDESLIEASGTIEAKTVNLTAKVAGTIQSLNYKAGNKVDENALIAELQRTDLVAQTERDELNVVIAQNKLDDMLSGARAEEIKEAVANVNIRQAALDKAKTDWDREKALNEAGSIALAELEVYENNHIVALNQLDAAMAKLKMLQLGSREEQVKAAENQVRMMQAVLKSTQAMLADLKISTPLGGFIQSLNYEKGEYVTVGSVIGTIAKLDKVWINVYISTEDLPFVAIGDQAQFSVSGVSQLFQGTITEIATKGEFTPKTIQTKKERVNIVYKVKIEADNPEGLLKPGMPADVIIVKKEETKP